MESEQRRKRKRVGKTYSSHGKHFTLRSFILCVSFVFVVFLVVHRFPFNAASFRPVLATHFLYSSSSAASNSLVEKRQSSLSLSSPAKVGDRVVFPDHVLLFTPESTALRLDGLDCVYRHRSQPQSQSQPEPGFSVRPVLSSDGYDESRSIVRCPLPSGEISAVDLRWQGDNWVPENSRGNRTALTRWNRLVYEAAIDGDSAVVFVKGLNLRPHRKADPSRFRCRFGLRNGGELSLAAPAIAAAQEVVRCAFPRSFLGSPEKARGIRVTLSHGGSTLPSVARLGGSSEPRKEKKRHELCACTMVWNQAAALREWISYHAWLGVERWFVYDNNSDDGLEKVVEELDELGFNVSRRSWPWIKTQEAGFSHCALAARDHCKWVGFFDVDEFFYFPGRHSGQNSLAHLLANHSSSDESIAELRTTCHSFGPSGLTEPPSKGVTVGYTCRLLRPERHKSIVRPDALDHTLLNVVHHFRLREGFRYLNVPESAALINHYKYQVWETFQAKFHRRVATYVVDWREDQNKGSKDRAPGLGTEAIEPPNWKLQFCDVWDTGLKDFVLANLAHPATGSLPWEHKSQARL